MPAKDSSSLNADLFPSSYTVKSARYSANGGSVRLVLSPDETLVLPAKEYALRSLGEGSVISRESLFDLKRIEAVLRVKTKALRLLAVRPRTTAGLKRRLEESLVDKQVVMSVLNELSRLGYLDDRKYAEEWLHSRLKRKAEGRWLLLRGLMQQGIMKKEAEKTVAEHYPPALEEQCCRTLISKLRSRGVPPKTKMLAALSRRGFSSTIIRKVMKDFH